VYEQGEENGPQRILTTGGLGDENKGKRKGSWKLCAETEV